MGTVCLKHSRDNEAIGQLQLAAQWSPDSYLPAWPVLVRTHTARKDYASASRALSEWAQAIEKAKADRSDEESKDDAARVGQTMHQLLVLGETKSVANDSLAECNSDILVLLTGSRREAYETGKRNAQREDTAAALPPGSALDELDDKRQSVRKDEATSRTAPAKFRGEKREEPEGL